MAKTYPSLRTVLDEFRDSGHAELRDVSDYKLHWLLTQTLRCADQAVARLDRLERVADKR